MRRRNGRLSSHVLSTVTVVTSDLITDVCETLNLLPEHLSAMPQLRSLREPNLWDRL